jgi:hypothetical protein
MESVACYTTSANRNSRAIQSQGSTQQTEHPSGHIWGAGVSEISLSDSTCNCWYYGSSAIDLLVLESEAAVSDVKEKLKGLEADLQKKGGTLANRNNLKGADGTAWIIGIVVAVGSILLLANQVGPQQRERWGIGLLGFGAGVAVGKINRGRP